jgi:predicted TIM-barrel fold metal-dependent hydrolase
VTDWNRRSFLGASLISPALTLAPSPATGSALGDAANRPEIIDTHVYLSRWPTRRMDCDGAAEHVALLRQHGVTQAWAGSFDALLHKDVSAVNSRLVRECREHGAGFLIPFGAINPKLPDWEEDLRRCQEEFGMPGIRLHPNYHNYTVSDPDFLRLLRLTAERCLIVQIVPWMEDERCMNPVLRVPTADLSALPSVLEEAPQARIAVMNGVTSVGWSEQPPLRFPKARRVVFDIAILEGMMDLRGLVAAVGLEHIVFGSYSPMFYFESAALKLREAALTDTETRAVLSENARRLLTWS